MLSDNKVIETFYMADKFRKISFPTYGILIILFCNGVNCMMLLVVSFVYFSKYIPVTS